MTQFQAHPHDGSAHPRLVAVIPAHNEERHIGSVVLLTRAHVDAVVVVDDGSCDATAQIARAAGAIVIRHDQNCGKGAALNTGLQAARELEPAAIVLLDGDGQHLPHEVPAVLAPILAGRADLVIGSRYLNGSHDGVPGHRVWGHRAFNLLTRVASGVAATDSQSGYRALSPHAVDCVSFSSRGFSVESEMQFLAREHGLRLAEVPITADYADRPKRPVAQHGMMVLSGVLRLVGQYRPLLFFGLPGTLLLLAGLGWGLWVVELYRAYGGLAVGYAMISVLLTIVGAMALTTGLILHSIRGLLLEFFAQIKGANGKHN